MLYRMLTDMSAKLGAGIDAAPVIADGLVQLRKAGFDPIDYLSLVDAESLQPVGRVRKYARLAAAAYLGRTRLIDNIQAAPR